jgi:hypothetical protein
MKEQDFDSTNFMRTLTMTEKAVNRLIRRNYYDPSQWPDIIVQIQNAFDSIRSWINNYKIFSRLRNYHLVLNRCLHELSEIIALLIDKCKPLAGKKRIKKSRKQKEQNDLKKSIHKMLTHLERFILINESCQNTTDVFTVAFEKAIPKAFEQNCLEKIRIDTDFPVSARGDKTYVFPWPSPDTYEELVNDRDRLRNEILGNLSVYVNETGHKKTCKGSKSYKLCGFRAKPRRTTLGNVQREIPIRMIKCTDCGEKFSLLPSFLPREKNFGIDIIGNVLENAFRFCMSINGVLQNLKTLLPKSVKSKQTIFNWLRWIGTLHPAVVLTRAGVAGSGYLQEDEGFEKEPQLRTYSVVMVDPKYQLVWHSDYVDHVDETTLTQSFDAFIRKIDFKILGVTKDKWRPSTKALKSVFKNIWLGFCHRHYLKKLYIDLLTYQKITGCSGKEINRLYKKVKKILKTSNSKTTLRIKLDSMNESAFGHSLLRLRLDDLKANAVYYTSNRKRKGITQTTAIVDNFLKMIKRKLRQVESFRDRAHTRFLFRAMANGRNFLPFLPGAKSAHKSPFMLASGETFNLPWIQTMNVHNAFLFTENAC